MRRRGAGRAPRSAPLLTAGQDFDGIYPKLQRLTHLFSNGGKFFFYSAAAPPHSSVARFPLSAASDCVFGNGVWRRVAPHQSRFELPARPVAPSGECWAPLALFCRPATQSFGSVMGKSLQRGSPPPPPPALPPSPLHGLGAHNHRGKREKSPRVSSVAVL